MYVIHIHTALLNISISKWVAIALGKHWNRYFAGIIPLLLEQVQHFKLLRLLQHQGEDQEVEEHQQAKEHQLYLLLRAHTCPTEDYTSISETCWTSAPVLGTLFNATTVSDNLSSAWSYFQFYYYLWRVVTILWQLEVADLAGLAHPAIDWIVFQSLEIFWQVTDLVGRARLTLFPIFTYVL